MKASNELVGYHDFFVAAASVAGALVGLLFVAITVAQDRDQRGEGRHRIRAGSAFTAFTNVLIVSLFGLVPGIAFDHVVACAGAVGLAFVLGGTLALWRLPKSWALVRDALYLAGLAAILTVEVSTGVGLGHSEGHAADLRRLATLLVVSTLFGIARSWGLIEGPAIGVTSEITELAVRAAHRHIRPVEDGSADRSR